MFYIRSLLPIVSNLSHKEVFVFPYAFKLDCRIYKNINCFVCGHIATIVVVMVVDTQSNVTNIMPKIVIS